MSPSVGPPNALDRFMNHLAPREILTDPQADGRGVRVAVIDSGIERDEIHRRCAERDQAPPEIEGVIIQPNRPEPLPYQGRQSSPHGTTVADIILRLAPRVSLFSADVFGPRGTCEVDSVIRAIRHALDVWKCHLINVSLGVVEQQLIQVPKRQQLQLAVEEAYFRDVLLVAAAHNEHPLTRSYPAVFAPPLVSVDKGIFDDPLSFRYSLSSRVEFRAHGRGYIGPFSREPATSWAAPHLTGVCARLMSLKPGMKPFEIKTLLYWLGHETSTEDTP